MRGVARRLEMATGRIEVAWRTAGRRDRAASHLPTEWMCSPWNPGVNLPDCVVCTVTVAYPSVNWISAVATVVPSGELHVGG